MRRYFEEGYPYKTILRFLRSLHGLTISMRTLKRVLKHLKLRRRLPRNCNWTVHLRTVKEMIEVDSVASYIFCGNTELWWYHDHTSPLLQKELHGSGRLIGYRAMWHRIKWKYKVPVARWCWLYVDPTSCLISISMSATWIAMERRLWVSWLVWILRGACWDNPIACNVDSILSRWALNAHTSCHSTRVHYVVVHPV